jgi:hypothetical protein
VNGKKTAALLCAAIALLPLAAQEAGPWSLADLDREAEKTADAARAFIKDAGGGSVMAAAGADYAPLARYWAEQVLAALVRDGGGILVKTSDADYLLSALILDLGGVIRIHTRLTRGAVLAANWTADFQKTPYLAEAFQTGSGGGVFPDRFEPDSRSAPVNLELGAEIKRTLHQNDEDWFLVTAPADGGLLAIQTSGKTDTSLEVFGEGGVIAEDDDSGDDLNARAGFMAEGGKSYTIRVKSYSNDIRGDYTIRADRFDVPDKGLEPNDSAETASEIHPGAEIRAYIASETDTDWYRIHAPPGGGYFSVWTEGETDTWLALSDSAGKQLAEDDDSGDDFNARISMFLSSGLYYITAGAYKSGLYVLKTRFRKPSSEDPYENDNTRENAKPIALGEVQTRTFTTEDDVDWAVFTAASRGVYSIDARSMENGELDTYLTLYDEGGQALEENDDGGSGYNARIRRRLAPGTYYIRVDVLENAEGSYMLSVRQE